MKIGITSDHRGFELKTKLIDYLKKKNFEVVDFGPNSTEMVDYTIYAFNLGERVAKKEVDFGIVICGTGIGISIACNKVKGIRCAKVDNAKEAELTRKDNDANVLALNGSMPLYRAKDIVDKFFSTDFSNVERYIKRIGHITEYENGNKNNLVNLNLYNTKKEENNE
ncbi:MAG: RpiB/LacA/LacB family sugar-phosphate isomerase [Firmicutes bacterium]|nr:RpiB/LacA/LacB family sugar-phosphate isomerase [Bacillota bacterium]